MPTRAPRPPRSLVGRRAQDQAALPKRRGTLGGEQFGAATVRRPAWTRLGSLAAVADATAGGSAAPSSEATRGGASRPRTAASGATYRSLTQRERPSISSSKKRTGRDRPPDGKHARPGCRSVGPQHPAAHRARRETAPARASRPRVAPSPGARRYVNGRSRDRTGRSRQTETGPPRMAALSDGAAEILGAVGRLPGELLAPEVSVRGVSL